MASKKQTIPKSVVKRLKAIPGSARQKLDPKTGKIYSRRQYENSRVRPTRKNATAVNRKFQQYLQIRDSYIEKKAQKGKIVSKRDAMSSDELKQVIKDLHSKDPQKKKRALQKTARGDKVKDWTPYLKRWAKGDL